MRQTAAALVGIGLLIFSNHAQAQSRITIKFSHVVTPDTPKGKGAEKFKELAEKYSGGVVDVQLYPNSSLYKDKEELEALQLGAVQMLAPANSKLGPIGLKEFEVFDLPFIIPDVATLRKITDGTIGQQLLKLFEAKGMVGLAFWDNGFKQMSANKPLHRPSDYKGVKFRNQSSKVLEAQFRALGAIPQMMGFAEVYQALQTGVVDGQENTWSNIRTQKLYEVQRFITETNHGYTGYVVVVNKQFWEGLPSPVRADLERAIREATAYTNSIAAKENDDAKAEIVRSGKTVVLSATAEELAEMRKSVAPIYNEMGKRVGKQLIDDVIRTVSSSTN
ncbi:C4-dicarboxylate-binding protein DctP [Nitrobacteraceae bacterium AZCC 2161]